jgi:hypothetical protein
MADWVPEVDTEFVERDLHDNNLPRADTRVNEGIARKALSADGSQYIFTVSLNPTKVLPGCDNLFVFSVPAQGLHAQQRDVLIRDFTARPNRQYPFIMEMDTVQGTLMQIRARMDMKDLGHGSWSFDLLHLLGLCITRLDSILHCQVWASCTIGLELCIISRLCIDELFVMNILPFQYSKIIYLLF